MGCTPAVTRSKGPYLLLHHSGLPFAWDIAEVLPNGAIAALSTWATEADARAELARLEGLR